MKKYISDPRNRQRILLSLVLIVAGALIAGTVIADTTFSSNTITSDGGITITPAGGQAVTVSGNLTVTGTCTGCGSGSATPAGADTQVQFNDGGSAFGANSGLTYNKTTHALTATGPIAASNFTGTSSGTNTGDQTITLTGDVTGSGTGSFAATIGAGRVTLADLANLATTHLIGRSTAGTGVPESIAIGSGLSLSGGTLSASGGSFSGLLGNNSPSLSSPKNAAFAINQDYAGALGSNQDDAATIQTVWAPTGSAATGFSDSLLLEGTLQGAQNFTNDMYGLHVHQEDQSSATVTKIEGIRTEASVTTGSGTASAVYGVGSVVHADHGTITDGHDFNAYSPEVGTSGAMTRGVEYFGNDPLGSGCTSCLSQFFDFGSAGNMIIAPSPAAGIAYGTGPNLAQINSTLNNAQIGTEGGNIFTANPTFTPTADFAPGAYYTASNGSYTIIPAHNITDAAWNGLNGEVSVNGSASATGNFTGHNGNPSFAGVNGEWDYFAPGTVDAADAIETFVGGGPCGMSCVGGTITNGTSIHINAPYETDNVVTNYSGLEIDNQTWPGSTTNYAIKYNSPYGAIGFKANGFFDMQPTVTLNSALDTTGDLFNTELNFTPSADYTTNTIVATQGDANITAAHNISTAVIGGFFDANVASGSGNLTEATTGLNGLQGEMDFSGTGTVTEANAFETFYGANNAGGHITNGQSIYITKPYSTLTAATNYDGILIEDQTWTGATQNWAIRYEAPGTLFTGITASGAQVDTPGTFTIANNGVGSSAAAATLTPTTTEVKITCNDPDGCNVTMGETGIKDGQVVKMINVGTNTVNFADTSGVSELAGAFAAGQWDAITLQYVTDRWVEMSRSNN